MHYRVSAKAEAFKDDKEILADCKQRNAFFVFCFWELEEKETCEDVEWKERPLE